MRGRSLSYSMHKAVRALRQTPCLALEAHCMCIDACRTVQVNDNDVYAYA